MRSMNLSCLTNSSNLASMTRSSHALSKRPDVFNLIMVFADSSLIINTGSIIILIMVGSTLVQKVSYSINSASLGKNQTAARRIRQVLSQAKLIRAGISFSCTGPIGSTLMRGSRFSIKETMTSVLLFLSKIETMGIRCVPASSDEILSANLQMENAMLPLTCWLLSVASYSLSRGSIVQTTRLVVQLAARSDNLLTDSERTSGSLSPNRVTQKGKIDQSTCSRRNF